MIFEKSMIKYFTNKYGNHYAKKLKFTKPNPNGKMKTDGNISVWTQNLLAGGQYATAWTERELKDMRTHLATIADSVIPDLLPPGLPLTM